MTIFTGDKLLESIKRGITIPFNQTRFTDSDLLAFADEELETTVLPILLGMREEFAVYQEDVDIVANQAKYQIPSRASGRILRDLESTIASGDTISLAYIAPDDRAYYTNSSGGGPSGFYFENDNVVLVPTPTSSGQVLNMRYLMRHSSMTKVSDARVVSNINTFTNEVTLSSAFPPSVVSGSLVDLIKSTAQPVILDFNIIVTNISSTTITLSSLPTSLVVGDYVSIAGFTPVVCLPEECNQVLAQAVAVRVMEAQGDQASLQICQTNLDRKLKAMQTILMPRIQGETQVVIQRNGLLPNRRRRNIMSNLRV